MARLILFPASLLAGLILLAPSARAERGTLLMLESSAGSSTPAPGGELPKVSVGVAFGPTLKHRRFPARLHLLGNIQLHGATVTGAAGEDRSWVELHYFASGRVVLPVLHPIRFYLELGLGARQTHRELPSGMQLAVFEPLLVVAGGAQLRWYRDLSLGLRVGVEPLARSRLLVDAGPTGPLGGSLALTVGVHF